MESDLSSAEEFETEGTSVQDLYGFGVPWANELMESADKTALDAWCENLCRRIGNVGCKFKFDAHGRLQMQICGSLDCGRVVTSPCTVLREIQNALLELGLPEPGSLQTQSSYEVGVQSTSPNEPANLHLKIENEFRSLQAWIEELWSDRRILNSVMLWYFKTLNTRRNNLRTRIQRLFPGDGTRISMESNTVNVDFSEDASELLISVKGDFSKFRARFHADGGAGKVQHGHDRIDVCSDDKGISIAGHTDGLPGIDHDPVDSLHE